VSDRRGRARRLAPCLDEARERIEGRADEIRGVLSAGGAFMEQFEWRISTEAKWGIEKLDPEMWDHPDLYRCWSGTAELWEIWIKGELEALVALGLMSELQMSFFRSLGWPSWPSAVSLDADTPAGWKARSAENACERYLAELWEDTRSARERDREAMVGGISAVGSWESKELTLEARISVEASAPGVQLSTNCPTPLRALEVGLVYREIAADISAAFFLND